jgi:hypothetical protein
METKVNVEQFKQWAKDVQPAAKAVLMARVFAQMERERVNAYVQPILASYAFKADAFDGKFRGGNETITKSSDLYLTEDPRLPEFYAACDKAHRDHGFTGPDGHCPALTAEHLLVQTEQALIELAKPLFGIDDVYGENRTKYLELLIGACFAKS